MLKNFTDVFENCSKYNLKSHPKKYSYIYSILSTLISSNSSSSSSWMVILDTASAAKLSMPLDILP